MDGDILRDIVAAEKEIQLFLEAEAREAQELVERVRSEQKARLEQARNDLEGVALSAGEQVVAEAKAEARRILLDTERGLSRCRSVDQATLRELVLPCIRAIMPGAGR